MLVDSTRKGRTLPDSFSRTVPLWAACISRVAAALQRAHGHRPCLPPDTPLYTPPQIVPPSEHAKMEGLLPQRCAALLTAEYDLAPLLQLDKPIRPLWMHAGSLWLRDHLPTFRLPDFYTVVCLSASPPVDTEQRAGYLYVQGAADDEELWAQGLTAPLFWAHRDTLLEAARAGHGEELIRTLLAQEVHDRTGCLPLPRPIGTTLLRVGLDPSAVPANALLIACGEDTMLRALPAGMAELTVEGLGSDLPTTWPAFLRSSSAADTPAYLAAYRFLSERPCARLLLHLQLPCGRKHKHELEAQLPQFLFLLRLALAQGRPIFFFEPEPLDRYAGPTPACSAPPRSRLSLSTIPHPPHSAAKC